jgi:hypothetical protein
MQLQRRANGPCHSGALKAHSSNGRVVVARRGSGAIARGPTVSVRAIEVESDVEGGEIDPVTGMVRRVRGRARGRSEPERCGRRAGARRLLPMRARAL